MSNVCLSANSSLDLLFSGQPATKNFGFFVLSYLRLFDSDLPIPHERQSRLTSSLFQALGSWGRRAKILLLSLFFALAQLPRAWNRLAN